MHVLVERGSWERTGAEEHSLDVCERITTVRSRTPGAVRYRTGDIGVKKSTVRWPVDGLDYALVGAVDGAAAAGGVPSGAAKRADGEHGLE